MNVRGLVVEFLMHSKIYNGGNMKIKIIAIILFIILTIAYSIDIDEVENLFRSYRSAFNSGNSQNFAGLVTEDFSYPETEPHLSRQIFFGIVSLAPYKIIDIANITIYPIRTGIDSAMVGVNFVISYDGIRDTIPNSFIVVKQDNRVKLCRIIDPDIEEKISEQSDIPPAKK